MHRHCRRGMSRLCHVPAKGCGHELMQILHQPGMAHKPLIRYLSGAAGGTWHRTWEAKKKRPAPVDAPCICVSLALSLRGAEDRCGAGQDHRRGVTCLMSSSVAPGKPTEMQLRGPEYCTPCNSFPKMPCSAHLHPGTALGRVQGKDQSMRAHLGTAGLIWGRVCRATGHVPELTALLVVSKPGIAPSVACQSPFFMEL